MDILINKSLRALENENIYTLVLGGGVSANSRLRQKLSAYKNIDLRIPPTIKSTDNGMMVAYLAHKFFDSGYRGCDDFSAMPDLPLDKMPFLLKK